MIERAIIIAKMKWNHIE